MIRIVVAGLVMLLPLAAADFWLEKKFPEWSEKQVKRMMEDSPWARPVSFRGERPGSENRRGDMSNARDPSPSRSSPGRGNAEPPQAPPSVTALIRWHTALPIRQAVARSRYGKEAATSPEAAKLLEMVTTRYIAGVIGLPTNVARMSDQELKEHVLIRLKNKPAIMAEEIRVDRRAGGVDVYCSFPKGRNGSPVIEVEDGEVELELQLREEKISRKFRLKDMIYEGKLEI